MRRGRRFVAEQPFELDHERVPGRGQFGRYRHGDLRGMAFKDVEGFAGGAFQFHSHHARSAQDDLFGEFVNPLEVARHTVEGALVGRVEPECRYPDRAVIGRAVGFPD